MGFSCVAWTLLTAGSRPAKPVPTMSQPDFPSVTVTAPARLHLGFVDLNGDLGRRFGSLGLALDQPACEVHASAADEVLAHGPQAERAAAFARHSLAHLGLDQGVNLTIRQAIPEHAGLGSGTQLALAVGSAVARLYSRAWPPRLIAHELQRGARSGIGLGAFDQGGFVLDGGRGEAEQPPPLIARLDFPRHWRLLLIFDPTFQGLHGQAEKQAFARLPAFPADAAARLCRLTLMQLLPALAEADAGRFAAAISRLQAEVGDHFAPAQGGRYASAKVARALAWCQAQGVVGVGQSSWGPTGFALLDSELAAHALMRAARDTLADAGLSFLVCAGRNQGAEIRCHQPLTEQRSARQARR